MLPVNRQHLKTQRHYNMSKKSECINDGPLMIIQREKLHCFHIFIKYKARLILNPHRPHFEKDPIYSLTKSNSLDF